MKTILSASSAVAILGVLATAAFSADTGYATETRPMGAQEIVIDPAMVEPAKPAEVPAAESEIEYVFTPVEGKIIPDPVETEQVAVDETPKSGGKKAGSLAELVAMQPTTVQGAEMECLAGTVYFESGAESLNGQLAVAEVVINRSKSGRFPSTICGVVYQKSQFSFVRGGKMPKINKSSKTWRNAVAIAHIAVEGSWSSPVKGSLFFHATYVSPGWRLTRTGTVGNHVFYR